MEMSAIDYRKRNLIILCIANFFIAGSLTMILPFISLYINTLGDFSDEYVQRWSGLIFGVSFLTGFLFSPVWGRVGDKKGRKKILVLFGTGVSVCILLMGFSETVQQLFFIRLFMGLFAGFIPTAQALIAVQTPKHEAGKVLGTLQTGSTSGILIGPLLGGVLADTVGFQYTFTLTAFLTGLASLGVAIIVKERQGQKKEKTEKTYTSFEVLKYIFTAPVLLTVMLCSTIIQIANFAIQPLLALYVQQMQGSGHIALLSGLAFSITGLGNLMFTREWGKLGDRVGYEKVMIVLCFMCALVYIPQAWVSGIWLLIMFRFLTGVFQGGIIPCRTAYFRQVAPRSIQGEILGYNMSFRFIGNFTGPMIGGMLAGIYGIPFVFYFTAALFMISGMLLAYFYVREKLKQTSEPFSG